MSEALLTSYEAYTSTSSRDDVRQLLQALVIASPHSFSASTREKLVQILLDDVYITENSGKASRLAKPDVQLALSAVKTLGRVPAGSQIISEKNNLSSILQIIKILKSSDEDAMKEALRCIANALLLIPEGRNLWAEIHGADYCVEILRTSNSPDFLFLASRILFLSSADATSPLIPALLSVPQTSTFSSFSTPIFDALSTTSSSKQYDIIEVIGSRLDFLLPLIIESIPMSKEAMIDLLKFTFNLLVHWPKIADSYESNSNTKKGKGKAKDGKKSKKDSSSEPDKKVLGERWSERLDGILAPLIRTFNGLPATSPSPLTAPTTHVLHSLITVPVNRRLYTIWFPEGPIPSNVNDDSSNSSGSDSPVASNDSPLPSTSRSDTPVIRTFTKERDREGRESKGAFDRALSMFTPRMSLSSRPSSPAPPSSLPAISRSSSYNGSSLPVPHVFIRAIDLLDVSLEYYLPENVDPDDKSVRDRCSDEDVKLEDVISPLVVLITRLCSANEECRKVLRIRILPPDLDRTSPLEDRKDTLGRCLRILSCVQQRIKDAVGELLFAVCDSDSQNLAAQIGFGNAAGFLYNKGIMGPPPQKSASSEGGPDGIDLNPITGMVQGERLAEPEMTEEEKEIEAEKLFVLFERLERVGGGENPLRKALHEGKLEKYQSKIEQVESDSD